MKLSKALKSFQEIAKETDEYWIEKAKVDFAVSLDGQRRRSNLSFSSLAKAIGTSAAYITKIFRGDSNYTVETMVKLARATGGKLDLRIVDNNVLRSAETVAAYSPDDTVDAWNLNNIKILKVQRPTAQSVTVLASPEANNESFALAA